MIGKEEIDDNSDCRLYGIVGQFSIDVDIFH